MTRRLARSSVSQSFTPKPSSTRRNTKRKSRSQDAFALASASDPDNIKIRQHRLGESELDIVEPQQKRQRMLDDETDDENDEPASNARRLQQRNVRKGERGPGGFQEEDISSGSDGEGNHWRVGLGDEDDDESLDSDEAFGDSDEERFDGFSFRGSKNAQKQPKRFSARDMRFADRDDIDLNEAETPASNPDDEASDDSLGPEAVDLATALDQDDTDEALQSDEPDINTQISDRRAEGRSAPEDDWAGFSDSDMSDAAKDNTFDSDEDDEENISSFTDEEDNVAQPSRSLSDIATSFANPHVGDSRVSPSVEKEDEAIRERMMVIQKLFDEGLIDELPKRRLNDLKTRIQGPPSQREANKFNRIAAYKNAKEALDQWQDTVKHTRRAEHLHFPLVDPEEQHPQGAHKLLPATTSQPQNELETTIEDILQQSGLAASGKKADNHDNEKDGDDLPESDKRSRRNERARLMELRKARELIFREEQRAKRIKKIKSKAYRRIHRKERDRNDYAERQERQRLVNQGMLSEDEDERSRHDRRRAEERMGSRHKNSRWAKSVKATGRTGWDDDAKDAMNELNARDQDLRMRLPPIEDDDSGRSISNIDSDAEDAEFQLRDQVDATLDARTAQPGQDTRSRLASLKFMQRANENQRRQNDEDARRLRRELAGDGNDSGSEESDVNMGRRVFGPSQTPASPPQKPAIARNEFEEPESSDSDDVTVNVNGRVRDEVKNAENDETRRISETIQGQDETSNKQSQPRQRLSKPNKVAAHVPHIKDAQSNSSIIELPTNRTKATSHGAQNSTTTPPSLHQSPTPNDSRNSQMATQSSAPLTAESTTQPSTHPDDSNNNDDDDDAQVETAHSLHPSHIDQASLIAEAFGIDPSVDQAFSKEKQAAESDEEDTFESTFLPGWGSWTGAGIASKPADQSRKFLKKTESGVEKSKRKDRNKKNVIISEKGVRKNKKYLADSLPHPFEGKEQYERSLRLPMGPEWNTKEALQSFVKPRVMVKQGIVKPMRKPLV
ncbi:MAG: hypothetical protein Q9162_002032 [Coniocarpon cinnabarinum]